MSQPPRNKPQARQVSSRSGGQPPPRDYRNSRPRNVAPQRDPFPYVMGGVIGALVVGLMLVIALLLNKGSNNGPVVSATSPTTAPGAAPATTAPDANAPPRMAIEDFKKLYDSANRPLIIDVRAKDAYDQGHIVGAESFPEADVDTRIAELPKDKLVIAYCQ